MSIASRVVGGGEPFRASATRTLRWVLAHEPLSVFTQASRAFSESVSQGSGGALEVRVLTASEFAGEQPAAPPFIVWKLVSNELEMAQTYTPLFGQFSYMLWTLDLPFLFRDHAHARRVLDGPIGERLMAGLLDYNIRGLAFTYSGGYRVVATTGRAIRRWEDFEGLRVRTSHSPVSTHLLKSLGAEPVPSPSQDVLPMTEAGRIDAAETTYPRYWALKQSRTLKTVCETHHSLFLTLIAVSEAFYQGLPGQERELLRRAAREAAAMEREESVAEGERSRDAARAAGVEVVPFSDAQRERFRKKAEETVERFTPLFGRDLLDGIRGA